MVQEPYTLCSKVLQPRLLAGKEHPLLQNESPLLFWAVFGDHGWRMLIRKSERCVLLIITFLYIVYQKHIFIVLGKLMRRLPVTAALGTWGGGGIGGGRAAVTSCAIAFVPLSLATF